MSCNNLCTYLFVHECQLSLVYLLKLYERNECKKMHRKMVIYHSKCWPSKLATSFKNETLHDKFNKMTCMPSLIRVFVVQSMDSQGLKVSL